MLSRDFRAWLLWEVELKLDLPAVYRCETPPSPSDPCLDLSMCLFLSLLQAHVMQDEMSYLCSLVLCTQMSSRAVGVGAVVASDLSSWTQLSL